jgi:uroporphyrinogen decarboxylase
LVRAPDWPGGTSHWERIEAALNGKPVDRVPLSLWRHFPVEDETPTGLAAATLNWQKSYDFDFVKLMPPGTYGVEDWGGRSAYIPNDRGTRTVVRHGIPSPQDYPYLEQLNVHAGCLGRQLEAVCLVAEQLRGSAPLLMTVFSPLTTARKLVGERVLADVRLHPELLAAGLQIIADTTVRFALASLAAGATGIFFASQCSTYRLLTQAEYRTFGETYDLQVLRAVEPESRLTIVHAHGEDVMFDLAAGYPAHALNWHDRVTWPSLAEARPRFSGLLVGGLNEATLLSGSPAAVIAEAQDAISQSGSSRFTLGAGCVLSIDTPSENIRAAIAAVTRD